MPGKVSKSKIVKSKCVVCKKFFAPRNGLQRRCTLCQKKGTKTQDVPLNGRTTTDIGALIQQDLDAEVNAMRAELDETEENLK